MFVGGSNYVFIPELKKGKLCDLVEDYCSVSKVVYITATKYTCLYYCLDHPFDPKFKAMQITQCWKHYKKNTIYVCWWF